MQKNANSSLLADARFSVSDRVETEALEAGDGCFMYCTGGDALVRINTRRFRVGAGSEIIVLPHDRFAVERASDGFSVTAFRFGKSLFLQAQHGLAPAFFRDIERRPHYRHHNGSERYTLLLLGLAAELEKDTLNQYRTPIIINLLRCMLLNVNDKMQRQRGTEAPPPHSRADELFLLYLDLIHQYGKQRRDTVFYAGRMAISARYLSDICRKVAGQSAKEVIDGQVISKLKVAVCMSGNTLEQISDQYHFPDTAAMCRYFERLTGYTPKRYREKETLM